MNTTATDTAQVGDIVTVQKAGRRTKIEVTYIDDLTVFGLLPYATTYTSGGQYEGSYRGTKAAWVTEIVEVTKR